MAEKISIFVEDAPRPYGHFSHAIKYENSVFVSGLLPLDQEDPVLVAEDIEAQTRAVFKYLSAVMLGCTGQLSNITMMRVYLLDLNDHEVVDEISRDVFYFVPPARSVVQVSGLPFGARIMVEAEAQLNPAELKGGRML